MPGQRGTELNAAIGKIAVMLMKKDVGKWFADPVLPQLGGEGSALHAKYVAMIAEPMDLETLSENVYAEKYGSLSAFARDARLIFTNAMTFNAAEWKPKQKSKPKKKWFNLYWDAVKLLQVLNSEIGRASKKLENPWARYFGDNLPTSAPTPPTLAIELQKQLKWVKVQVNKNSALKTLQGVVKPVDRAAYPSYHLFVPCEVTIATIQKKLPRYRDHGEFTRDVLRMWANVVTFNYTNRALRQNAALLVFTVHGHFKRLQRAIAEMNRMDTEDMKECLDIYDDLSAQPGAESFFQDPRAYYKAGEYEKVIVEPMYLIEVQRRLYMFELSDPDQFASLVRLVFNNCIEHGGGGPALSASARKLLKWFERRFLPVLMAKPKASASQPPPKAKAKKKRARSVSPVPKAKGKSRGGRGGGDRSTVIRLQPPTKRARVKTKASSPVKRAPKTFTAPKVKAKAMDIVNKMKAYKTKAPKTGGTVKIGAAFSTPVMEMYPTLTDYLPVVPWPIDLRTIKERLNANHYGDEPMKFFDDMVRIHSNCYLYNSDPVNGAGSRWLADKFLEKFEELFDAKFKDLRAPPPLPSPSPSPESSPEASPVPSPVILARGEVSAPSSSSDAAAARGRRKRSGRSGGRRKRLTEQQSAQAAKDKAFKSLCLKWLREPPKPKKKLEPWEQKCVQVAIHLWTRIKKLWEKGGDIAVSLLTPPLEYFEKSPLIQYAPGVEPSFRRLYRQYCAKISPGEPMDLRTVLLKLYAQEYHDVSAFSDDVCTMLDNAVVYNALPNQKFGDRLSGNGICGIANYLRTCFADKCLEVMVHVIRPVEPHHSGARAFPCPDGRGTYGTVGAYGFVEGFETNLVRVRAATVAAAPSGAPAAAAAAEVAAAPVVTATVAVPASSSATVAAIPASSASASASASAGAAAAATLPSATAAEVPTAEAAVEAWNPAELRDARRLERTRLMSKFPAMRRDKQTAAQVAIPEIKTVLKTLTHSHFSYSFHKPFDWKAAGFTDYPLIVTDPIDLETLERRVKAGTLKTVGDVDVAFRRMWSNAKRYNEKLKDVENSVYQCAVKMEELYEEKWAMQTLKCLSDIRLAGEVENMSLVRFRTSSSSPHEERHLSPPPPPPLSLSLSLSFFRSLSTLSVRR